MNHPYIEIATALSEDPERLLARWIDGHLASPLRFYVGGEAVAPLLRGLFEAVVDVFVPALRDDEAGAVELRPGSRDVREAERMAAFVGARLGAEDTRGFDIVAVFGELSRVLAEVSSERDRGTVAAFVNWLLAVAADAFASARVHAAHERIREGLEKGTPVVFVTPEIPATLLVANPGSRALDTIFGELVLLVVRVGAPVAIVDLAGLVDPTEPAVVAAVEGFVSHRKVAGEVTVLISGATSEAESALVDAGVTGVRFLTSFDQAVAAAMDVAGLRLVRSSS